MADVANDHHAEVVSMGTIGASDGGFNTLAPKRR
jgi:hypothetical protein